MKNKTKITILLALFICASSIFFSYAYFIKVTTSKNVITFGTIKLELINNTIVDGKEVPVTDGGYIDIANNNSASRIVRVKNVGKHPMFLRVYLDVYFGNQRIEDELVDEYMAFNVDDSWTYKDGFYYFNEVLNSKEQTSNLFSVITFDVQKIRQDGYAGKVDVKVNVQAVQSENNSHYVLDANGWPAKQ